MLLSGMSRFCKFAEKSFKFAGKRKERRSSAKKHDAQTAENEVRMSIYKRGDVYWYKFMFGGKLVRESTKQGNDKIARNMESAHRTSLAQGIVGIRERKPVQTLAEFLKKDFLPYVETKHKAKPGTAEYYRDGANMVLKCDWSGDKLDQINDQHSQQFAAKFSISRLRGLTAGCGRFAGP